MCGPIRTAANRPRIRFRRFAKPNSGRPWAESTTHTGTAISCAPARRSMMISGNLPSYFLLLPLRERLCFLSKGPEQRERHRSGHAGANRSVVDQHNGHDLARRAGEERLIGAEQVVVSQDALTNGNAFFRADVEEKLAGDPGQKAGIERRGKRRAVLDDEEVRRGALGQLAAVVPH